MKRFNLLTLLLIALIVGLVSGVANAKSRVDYPEQVQQNLLDIPEGWEVGAIECSSPNVVGTACAPVLGGAAMLWQDWLKAKVGPTARIVSLYRDSRDNVMITYIYQP